MQKHTEKIISINVVMSNAILLKEHKYKYPYLESCLRKMRNQVLAHCLPRLSRGSDFVCIEEKLKSHKPDLSLEMISQSRSLIRLNDLK